MGGTKQTGGLVQGVARKAQWRPGGRGERAAGPQLANHFASRRSPFVLSQQPVYGGAKQGKMPENPAKSRTRGGRRSGVAV
jgi:hypothetical protein